jgi:hypothetical protein
MMMIKNKNLYIFTFSIKFLKTHTHNFFYFVCVLKKYFKNPKRRFFIKKYEFTKKIFL